MFILWAAGAGLPAAAAEAPPVAAGEVVFESAAVPPTELQVKLAKRRRQPPPQPTPGVPLSGRLTKPAGAGPFPAVVLLHGCEGRTRAQGDWAARLAAWGYVALQVDSFGPRGLGDTCAEVAGPNVGPRVFDAFGALAWLRAQPLVGRARIAVMGWGHGGTAALDSVLATGASSLFERGFAAAVALYPYCPGNMSRRYLAPVLILSGARDDLMPAARCRRIAAKPATGGDAITLVVFDEAYYGFDDPSLGAPHSRPEVLNIERSPSRGATFGYDRAAHGAAAGRVRGFLGQNLPSSR